MSLTVAGPIGRTLPASRVRVRPVPCPPRPSPTPTTQVLVPLRVPTLAERVAAHRSAASRCAPPSDRPERETDDQTRPAEPTDGADERAREHDPCRDSTEPPPPHDPTQVAQALCGALVEVCLGARPAGQLARWLTPSVLLRLRERARLGALVPVSHHVPVVRHLVVCPLGPAVEVAAAVDDSRRTRAVALRLEPHRGLWRVTALELA